VSQTKAQLIDGKAASVEFSGGSASTPSITFSGDVNTGIYSPGADQVAVSTNGVGRITVDSSGRLLVGTSTTLDINAPIQAASTTFGVESFRFSTAATGTGGAIDLARSNSGTVGTTAAINSGQGLGIVRFRGAGDSSTYITGAQIEATSDGGTVSATSMPTRLVFSTTADGAATPTERMRITADGDALFGKQTFAANTNGAMIGNLTGNSPVFVVTNDEGSDSSALLIVNRQVSDGRLAQFRHANTTEGTISVSGTTVTYGGGHLARWSQLPNNEDPSSILKGTVLSNLDEMCEWDEEDNEQLNRMKVSDIEGDTNVAGVFVSTSFDEEGPHDFFCAMTGDMVIRIAAGTTVQRGDLLMSAGDGTAKPQDDDIIRSKTIAKVTSTNVSCTHPDGSYCVPCVLMAC
jgi:hypothetical protein